MLHAEFLVTLRATEWLQSQFLIVDSFMSLEIPCIGETLTTLGANKWFLVIVNSFMSLQIICSIEYFVTLRAIKCLIDVELLNYSLISVDSLMPLQITGMAKLLCTL